MAKKLTVLCLALVLIAICGASLVACDADNDGLTIVYIGDSIAEALIGPSPLAERDNYGYYAVVGKTNNMRYFNHSVSGHKTSTNMLPDPDEKIGGLLGMLYRDDENGALMKSHLEQADIIHISVLGNNILQYNLGLLFYEIADPDFEDKFKEGTTLLNLLYTGSREPVMDGDEPARYENGRIIYDDFRPNEANTRKSLENENEVVSFDFPPTYQDLVDAIARIRQLNSHAKIIFQTVYNPFYQGSAHLHAAVINKLADVVDVTGRFGEAGAKITEISQFRKIADRLLDILNALIDKYIEEYHPANFYKLDVNAEFERITEMDKDENGNINLDEDCLGRQLIYQDWTHPSNFGHAIIAGATQKLLEELHLADPHALDNYKALRLDQLERLYTGVDGVDVDDLKAKISAATTYEEVTFAYFDGVRGFTPINY